MNAHFRGPSNVPVRSQSDASPANCPCSGGVTSATAAPAEKVGELAGPPGDGEPGFPTGGPWPGGVSTGGEPGGRQPRPPESLRCPRALPPRAVALTVAVRARQRATAARRRLLPGPRSLSEVSVRRRPTRTLRGPASAGPDVPTRAKSRTRRPRVPTTSTRSPPLDSPCRPLELTMLTRSALPAAAAPAGTTKTTAS